MITDPFGVYSCFSDLISHIFESPDLMNSEMEKLEKHLFENILMFAENKVSKSENFEKDIIGIVRNNSRILRRNYLFITGWIEELLYRRENLNEKDRKRILFWTRQLLYPMVPTNFLWSNPNAILNFFRTEGESIKKGYTNFLKDISENRLARLTKEKCFSIGSDIAATEGDVVFRNELFELIQYESVTENNYKTPIVLIQPWINKYYIFDLKKETSLVNYLRENGFTVFITSWKNPDSKYKNTDFEDYLFSGILTAVEVANRICDTEKCHISGYCIGGTALIALLGSIMNTDRHCPVSDISLFATLTDFESPGDISYFITEKSLELIKEIVNKNGYLDGEYISASFRSLKPESLINPYISNNYLLGSDPPSSDLLFWNSDSTNLPEKMCIYYLEEFYLKNNLINKNKLSFRNIPCDITRIDLPVYSVGAEQDHIAPWRETYKITNYIKSDIRFILSCEGHITGFVNPPSTGSRKKFRVIDQFSKDSDIEKTDYFEGSWWNDWVQWLTVIDNRKVASRNTGSIDFPKLCKAPGKYVLE